MSGQREENRALDACAIMGLLVLYFGTFLPQVYICDSVPTLTLPLAMSYAASSLIFQGWSGNPAIQAVVGSAASVNLAYPPGVFAFAKIAHSNFGDTLLHLNAFLLAVQALTPVFSYLILRRLTGRLWALLAAWTITKLSVFIYTIPDFYNQVFILASLWILLKAYENEDRRLLIPVGLLCAANAALKQNIGLAWPPAVTAFIFFQHLRSGEDNRAARRWEGLAAASIFPAYGLVASLFLHGADSLAFYSLPYAVFWGWVLLGLARGEKSLDARAFLRDFALFALPFVGTLGAMFVFYAWEIGLVKYFKTLFVYTLEERTLLDHTVAVRGLIYYGTGGRLDLSTPHKIKMLLLWFAPFAANIGMALALIRGPDARGFRDPKALPLAALSITGAYLFFPLESFFNLQTKLSIPLIAAAAFVAGPLRSRRAPKAAAALLLVLGVLPFFKHILHHARLWSRRDARLEWVGDPIGLYMPKAVAAELGRSLDILRARIRGRYYIVGSSSADMSMYYRLLDPGGANYYTDLRPGFINERAEADLIRRLADFPAVVADKKDIDLFAKDSAAGNASIRRLLGHLSENYEIEAAYTHGDGPPIPGMNDFYVMRRR